MNIYAVKVGRQKGIFNTWEACKEQIHGYSGAIFKAFTTEAEAAAFLQEEEIKDPIDNSLPYAYIDGSYSNKNACYGWGGFIENEGQRFILQGTGNAPAYMAERNIAGELIGALQVTFKCLQLGIKEINLYFDYAGIENYTTGQWEAKTPLARYYIGILDTLDSDVKVHYISLKGHTGIEGNDIADLLAKEAVGAQLRKKDLPILKQFKEGARNENSNNGQP